MTKWLNLAAWVCAVGSGLYCFAGLFCQWPLSNIIWLGAALGFTLFAEKCMRDLGAAS